MNRLVHVYAVLLNLYPHHFRTEFGDEMQRVFAVQSTMPQSAPRCGVDDVRTRSVGTAPQCGARALGSLRKGSVRMNDTSGA